MTYKEVFDMITSIGYPAAYNHFPQSTGMKAPYICFYYPGSNDYVADNHNYVKIEEVRIELFTDGKDFEAEKAVENVLKAHDLPFSREETYLDKEGLYMQFYTTEITIDGDKQGVSYE